MVTDFTPGDRSNARCVSMLTIFVMYPLYAVPMMSPFREGCSKGVHPCITFISSSPPPIQWPGVKRPDLAFSEVTSDSLQLSAPCVPFPTAVRLEQKACHHQRTAIAAAEIERTRAGESQEQRGVAELHVPTLLVQGTREEVVPP